MKTTNNDFQILKERIIEIQQTIEEMEKRIKKIHHYLLWSKVFTFLKVLLFVVVPLLLYVHFLPQIEKWLTSYKDLLKIQDEVRKNLNLLPPPQKISPEDLMQNKEQYEEMFKEGKFPFDIYQKGE